MFILLFPPLQTFLFLFVLGCPYSFSQLFVDEGLLAPALKFSALFEHIYALSSCGSKERALTALPLLGLLTPTALLS